MPINREPESVKEPGEGDSVVRRAPGDEDAHELLEHEFTLEVEDPDQEYTVEPADPRDVAPWPSDEHTAPWSTLPPLPSWAANARALLEPPSAPQKNPRRPFFDDMPTPHEEVIVCSPAALRLAREELEFAIRDKRELRTRAEQLESSLAKAGVSLEESEHKRRDESLSLTGELRGQGARLAELEVVLRSLQRAYSDVVAARDTAVATRDAAVVERDTAIATRDQVVAERDEFIAGRDAAVVARDEAIATRDAAVVERDAAIATRDEAVAARDRAVAKHDDAYTARDQAYAARDEALAGRDAAYAARDEALVARDTAYAARDQVVATRDQDVAARDTAIAERHAALAARDEALAARNTAFETRDEALATRNEALTACDDALTSRDSALADRKQAIVARDKALASRDDAVAARDEMAEQLVRMRAAATLTPVVRDRTLELPPNAALLEAATASDAEITWLDLPEPLAETTIELPPDALLLEASALGRDAEITLEVTPDSTPPTAARARQPKKRPPPRDDLTQITGIGKRFAERLNDLGIRTFAQVAKLGPGGAARVADQLGISTQRIARERWVKQAIKLQAKPVAAEKPSPAKSRSSRRARPRAR